MKRGNYKKWTKEDLEYLSSNYCKQENRLMAEYFGVSTDAIERKAKSLGLSKRSKGADGDISVRKVGDLFYKYIMTGGRWVLLHHYNWKQAGNKIPQGYVLRFYNGNRMNCEVGNLHLVARGDLLNNRRAAKTNTVEKQWHEQKLRNKARHKVLELNTVDYSRHTPVRIDHKTVILAKPGADIETIISQYKKTA